MKQFIILHPLPLPAMTLDEAIDALQGQIGGDNPLFEEKAVVLQRFVNTPFFLLSTNDFDLDTAGAPAPCAAGDPAAADANDKAGTIGA